MIDRLDGVADEAIVVIDYLQLLDQKRSNPSLDEQLHALNAYAKSNGSIVVMISQIDRAFDLGKKTIPDMSNIRMPNHFDIAYFDKACFVHEGDMQLIAVT